MKNRRNPLATLLIWVVRAYQILISPALPSSCRYYPSCSQYAIDGIRQFGILRGLVLAGWRLVRCNPWSRGGYDPVERQTLFRGRGVKEMAGAHMMAKRRRATGVATRTGLTSTLAIVVLAALLLLMPLSTTSCSFFGPTTTTVTATGGPADATTVPEAESTTTTTVAPEQQHPGSFDKVSKPLQGLFFWVLDFLHKNLRVSWSWGIVLLTVIIRIVLIPLTWRQIKSMRAMQALQPQLKALQEKYKDNRQVLNQKVMEFYRENNVSPFGSCLPLLLQLPVFLGLFYMLRTAGRAGLDPLEWGRWAGVFLDPKVGWLWIADITRFNIILMFLYVASQFLASWQMARKTGGQQKTIAYVMPVVVGVFMYMYKWPAGLMIYWFTSNLWTIAQQYVAEKVLPIQVLGTAAQEKGKAAAARPTGKVPARTGKKPSAPAGRPATKGGAKPAAKTPSAPAGKVATKGTAKTPSGPAGKPVVKSVGKKPSTSAGKSPETGVTKASPAPAGKSPAKPVAKTPSAPTGKPSGKSVKKTNATTVEKAAVQSGKRPLVRSEKDGASQSGKKTPAPAGKAPAKSGGKPPQTSPGKSGGVTSGRQTGQKNKTTGGEGQRTDGGTGGAESSGGA